MARAFVAIGSNLDPAGNTAAALRRLAREVHVRGISTVYLTESIGRAGQPSYYNCVVEIETELPPGELKNRVLRSIEQALGRKRGWDKYAPRAIDLDLVLYDDLAVNQPDFVLPDPDVFERPFLAVPISELAPELVLPGSGRKIQDVAAALPKRSMKPLSEYTEELRTIVKEERTLSEIGNPEPRMYTDGHG